MEMKITATMNGHKLWLRKFVFAKCIPSIVQQWTNPDGSVTNLFQGGCDAGDTLAIVADKNVTEKVSIAGISIHAEVKDVAGDESFDKPEEPEPAPKLTVPPEEPEPAPKIPVVDIPESKQFWESVAPEFKVSADELFPAWANGPAQKIVPVFNCPEAYHITTYGQLLHILEATRVDKLPYHPTRFNCLKMAQTLASRVAEKYGLACGVLRDYASGHAYNFFFTKEDKEAPVELWFIEPQTDAIIDPGIPEYMMSEGEAHI